MSTLAAERGRAGAESVRLGAPTRRTRRRRNNLRNALLFGALIAPNLIVILVFSYWPTIYNVYLSLTKWDLVDPQPTFVGLRNYLSMITDTRFHSALVNTAIFTGISTVGSLVGGILMGLLLAAKLRFSGFVRTIAFAPHLLPGAAIGVLWLFIFDPTYGLSRVAFELVGMDSPRWTTTSDWSVWAITLAYLWQRLGFVTIIYYTAILDLPKDVYEAASLDGASGWRLHLNLTLPLLSPATLFLSITGLIGAAQAFDIIATLTEGGPGDSSTTLSWLIYATAFRDFDIGMSAASATLMFLLLLALTVIQLRIGDRTVHYQ
ncbi:carbohydrate ABC transporter permease [Microlunatus parietis]|uniref:sn-glycerol 3-phosphate transport system permease protein n=1 Tax=Microlunatus parietis TaxID=682979 RepID=A0A7Y9IDF6_9ACTN|nr:sugar ABC transporter permease [Microlunatus parietis]NYE74662.1 sn-glycerol 3-phosphate transport system permease protein [Microlunatus parietis]